MRARVCTTWREAAKKTLVPPTDTDFRVNSLRSYNAMRVMATALPNLQQLLICAWECGIGEHKQKFSDGEDPDEEWARRTANYITHDISIIPRFRNLRSLEIEEASLNGRYPVLFDFQLLQLLSILNCHSLKFDLGMLSGLPSLKELRLIGNRSLTGNICSLRVLKDTLEKVKIYNCTNVEGNFMNLADFPRLKELNLICTEAITGDIRDIGEDDFPALESIYLPATVRGGMYCEFPLVSDVPSFMHAIHFLVLRTPTLFSYICIFEHWRSGAFGWKLSEASPDMYDREIGSPYPPFELQLIRAGSRRGWSWCAYGHSCEINWLDPEPISESDGYEAYIEDLQRIEQHINFYRGYYEPPTAEEYRRLCEGLEQRD